MTVPRLAALQAYWQHHPPLHIMVAAYLGVKSPPRKDSGDARLDGGFGSNPAKDKGSAGGDLGELLALFGADGKIR